MMGRTQTNRIRKNMYLKWLLPVVLIGTWLSLAFGRPAFQEASPVRSPFVYKLTTSGSSFCAGGDLSLNVEIKNISDETLALDTTGLLYQYGFEKSAKEAQENTLEFPEYLMQVSDPDMFSKGNFLYLYPQQSYKRSITMSLKKAFFEPSRTYKLHLMYGQFRENSFNGIKAFRDGVTSNDIEFEIKQCQATNQHAASNATTQTNSRTAGKIKLTSKTSAVRCSKRY